MKQSSTSSAKWSEDYIDCKKTGKKPAKLSEDYIDCKKAGQKCKTMLANCEKQL